MANAIAHVARSFPNLFTPLRVHKKYAYNWLSYMLAAMILLAAIAGALPWFHVSGFWWSIVAFVCSLAVLIAANWLVFWMVSENRNGRQYISPSRIVILVAECPLVFGALVAIEWAIMFLVWS
ncbi:MAG: hypothetical protein AAB480_00505 [Patescibacteria group bacterium]